MAYLGNDLQVAFPSYRLIDDISASFNGVLTTFALTIGGASPVPFPINPQQCLISVNGTIQKPDPTGTAGFTLTGTNIVFASAPTGGWAFFGVILAGADYVNIGANFPDGQVNAPSITFDQDTDTGFYRSASGAISFASNGVGTATFGSASFIAPSFIPTSSTVPTNGVYLPAANSVAISTNGTQRLTVDTAATTSTLPVVHPLGAVGTPSITFTGDLNTGIYSPAADTIAFAEGGAEIIRINSSGFVGIGTNSPVTKLDLSGNYGQNIVAVAALNIDCSTGNYFTKTINGASTFTVSSVPASRSYSFTLELTHTSGAITWFSGVEWPGGTAPTLTTGKTHLFMFVTDDGGSRWRGASLINYTT
jgi:hypothetical protein